MKWEDYWEMPAGELNEYVEQLPAVLELLTGEKKIKVQEPVEEAVI